MDLWCRIQASTVRYEPQLQDIVTAFFFLLLFFIDIQYTYMCIVPKYKTIFVQSLETLKRENSVSFLAYFHASASICYSYRNMHELRVKCNHCFKSAKQLINFNEK
jgi:hypothetical protein